MIYVYRRASSSGARELANALGGRRARGRLPVAERVQRGDFVICWGETLPNIDGVKILNGAPIQNKYRDALRLKEQGVLTIEVAERRPQEQPQVVVDPLQNIFNEVAEMAADFAEIERPSRERPFRDGLQQLRAALERLQGAANIPAPVPQPLATWLPRMNDHVGGEDLLLPPTTPDYWVKKLNLVREFRVHSFKGKSIRAGVKDLREGFTLEGAPVARDVHPAGELRAHPWIRSHEAGWRIKYDGVTSGEPHRKLAHAAVKALGLDFGAVDIGETSTGQLVVLEVNRAPGIEGGTIDVYKSAIEGWMRG